MATAYQDNEWSNSCGGKGAKRERYSYIIKMEIDGAYFKKRRWYHICFTYDHIKHLILTYLDGVQTNEQVYDVKGEIYGDYLNLGQGDIPAESFSGELTQVNVWDKVLPAEEIASIAKCQTNPSGNYISWEVQWILQDITSYGIELNSLCDQEVGTTYFWFPNLREATAMYICEALGTHLPFVRNQEEIDVLMNLAKSNFPADSEYANCYFKFWTDLNDKEVEGKWKHNYNGELVEEIFWSRGEPNGIQFENCGLINVKGIDDAACEINIRCAVCTFTEQKRFSLLGTCEAELRNVYFVAYKPGKEDLIFRGYGKYHIRLEKGGWIWHDVVGNVTMARMEKYVPNYPMGRRRWKLESEVCGQAPGGMRMLLLTPCSAQQFTCDDAACIPLSSRCDLRYDCKDKSDETNCFPIAFPQDYQQHLPPRPLEEEDSSLPIFIEAVIDALDVRTLMMTTEITYTIKMTWKENRVSYLNAKENNTLNILSYSTFKDLWTPMVNFVNTDGNYHTETDKESIMFINRLRSPDKRDEAAAEEVEVFFGEFNSVSIQRKYTTVYTCSFDLVLYPFDVQKCVMHLSITSAPRTFLYFKQENSTVAFSQDPKLLEYEVGRLEIEMDNTKFYSEARIIIPLRRLYGYAILNIYTPSLVLLVVSYITLFFRPTIFDVRMMSALTAQLVIATFFSQVSSTLPKTSYFKMVDVWLLFCIGITFLVIIFHAVVDSLINDPTGSKDEISPFSRIIKIKPQSGDSHTAFEEDPKNRGHQMVLITKIVTFVLFLLFNLIYWSYILS
ncbi:uncharacterized protein [Palaemon carinicauda]|uniref:uncharacterized protein n=1 Tax=Palaemon carinicauda TaxID=392227 RepID=UPI0035B64DB9